jgi:hypothetical protein
MFSRMYDVIAIARAVSCVAVLTDCGTTQIANFLLLIIVQTTYVGTLCIHSLCDLAYVTSSSKLFDDGMIQRLRFHILSYAQSMGEALQTRNFLIFSPPDDGSVESL